jgi:hypothetical protein
MKKNSLTTIANYIKNVPELAAEYAELQAELDKNAEKAQANRDLYAATHDVVIGALTDKPVTLAELWETVKDTVPEGMSKSKVQYALRELWAAEVVKIEGKVNEYKRA